jgi:uncharacterized protein (TIGR02678 family)
MSPVNTEIPALERAAYQRAARTILMSPIVTEVWPNAEALPLVRRWAAPLGEDLAQLFGYRLEMSPVTARLIRVHDRFDSSQPATTPGATSRTFDRRRYAYLALALGVLGRSGTQLALSELAERVTGETARIDGLELLPERAADRAAFVDAVAWLEARGALRLADGSARRWVDDPSAGEALYDIDRDVVRALYRPSRVLQHLRSATDLLVRGEGVSRDTVRADIGQRVRRALVENPVVYYDDLPPEAHGTLRNATAATEVADLTGLVVERRAEGVALLDVSGQFSDRRFPGTGTVAQVAFLLINRIADRVLDPDEAELRSFTRPSGRTSELAQSLDAALPRAELLDDDEPMLGGADRPEADGPPPVTYPLLENGWLRSTLTELLETYGSTFAAAMAADPERLLRSATALLTDLQLVVPVDGGVLALPLLARYRNAVFNVNKRTKSAGLFDV